MYTKKNIVWIISMMSVLFLGALLFYYGTTIKNKIFNYEKSFPKNIEKELRVMFRLCMAREKSLSSCFKKNAQGFIESSSPKDLLSSLALVDMNIQVRGFHPACHEFTHEVGKELFSRLGSLSKTFQVCDFACGGGCYHGAVEQYLLNKFGSEFFLETNTARLAAEVKKMCQKNDFENEGLYRQCLHGTGHALMFVTDDNLPVVLHICDELDKRFEKRMCYTGAFMENVMNGIIFSSHPARFIKEDDPWYPCTIFPDQYLSQCYSYQSMYVAKLVNWDMGITSKRCREIPSAYRAECYVEIGGFFAYTYNDPTLLKKGCDVIGDQGYRNECIKGMVIHLTSRYGSDAVPYMQTFCRTVNEENKESCYRQMGKVMTMWTKTGESVEDFCKTMPGDTETKWCLQGIRDG